MQCDTPKDTRTVFDKVLSTNAIQCIKQTLHSLKYKEKYAYFFCFPDYVVTGNILYSFGWYQQEI